ncbi:MAG: PAS domain S-box protein [Gammaproteobacteria bacterium]
MSASEHLGRTGGPDHHDSPVDLATAAETAALARLATATERLWTADSLEQGLGEMLDAVLWLLGADMGYGQLADTRSAQLEVMTSRGFTPPTARMLQGCTGPLAAVCTPGQWPRERVVCEEIDSDPAFEHCRAFAAEAGFRSAQCTPLLGSDGKLLGALATFWSSPHRMTDADRRRLDLYARQAAAYIERWHLERELRVREELLRAVLDTAADAIVSIDSNGVITHVNRATERMFGYTATDLLGRNVSMLMPSPYREEHDRHLSRYRATRQSRILDRSRELPGCRHDGSVFPAMITIAEVDHLGMFTATIRDLSERRELQQRLLDIADEEQRRLGQELHDSVQQELTGLSLFAASLHELLKASPDADHARLERVRQMTARLEDGLTEVHRQVQELARGIMPVQIDAAGLEAALQELAARTTRDAGVPCAFHSAGDVALESNAEATHLFRIAQEAVNNALRHARANRIDVVLAGRRDITLEIRDDGRGFAPGAGDASNRGIGLRTMEYRAGLLGGVLRIEPGPKSGVTVRCVVPRRG